MSKSALVVGGNTAAVQAALDLAESGIQVTLLEPSPFLRNVLQRPEDHQAQPSPASLFLEATKHPNITLLTNTRVTAVHGRKGDFRVEIEQLPRYVDLARCTACGDCVQVCPVTVAGRTAIHGPSDGEIPNVFVIDKRGVAPCKATCPGGIHAQGYVALIAAGRFQEAVDLVREAAPFPGVLGRVCYHPCETACRRGTEIDEPVSICALKRFVADYEVEHQGEPAVRPVPLDPTLGRVAIVGAGPAGLTVAYFLARQGVASDVFEALPVAGGMLAVGIPDYRLPPAVLQREIAAIEALGVSILLNHPVDDAEWERLRRAYSAIFVGVGAHRPRQLLIPGDDLPGVIPGVEFLCQVNLASATAETQDLASLPTVGRNVVVIGGGNTAIDSAMVAQRLGAGQVTVLYRRSRPEMLANPWEVEEAEAEGITFHFLASPVRAVAGPDGRIAELVCIENALGEPDQSGRRRPVPIEGSEFTLPCDTLLSAIGQTVSCGFAGLDAGRGGSILVDPVTLQTNLPNVFAGGDAVIGPASVIESIGDGRRAVESILRYLRGQELTAGRTAERIDKTQIDYYTPPQPVVRARVQMPHVPMEKRRTFAEVALGLSPEAAVAEAQRCLSCGICSECLACVAVCQPKAINHTPSAVETQDSASLLEAGVPRSRGAGVPRSRGAGVVIWADSAGPPPPVTRGNIYELYGNDPWVASAIAAQAMEDLAVYRRKRPIPIWGAAAPERRLGVFVCRCGEQIAGVLDVAALVQASQAWPGVLHAQTLPFACQPEGAAAIRGAMAEHGLNQVVLAACSCCSLDQVCDSCTYQRVRCKTNLLSLPFDLASLPVEFVNIREQCAWAHRDDPVLGTAKAERLIAAAVAKARLLHPALLNAPLTAELDGRVLVAGDGPAAAICADALRAQGFAVTRSAALPDQVTGSLGQFSVTRDGVGLQASAVVLAPAAASQLGRLGEMIPPLAADKASRGGEDLPQSGRLRGLLICPPGRDPEMTGLAVAAKVGALLGAGRAVAPPTIARVDAARCRACGTCESVCQHLAIRVMVTGDRAVAQVSPALCQGCGTCAAHCPSSAITAGYSTDRQIGAMLAALLGGGTAETPRTQRA